MGERPDLDAMWTMVANWTPSAPGINEQRRWAFMVLLGYCRELEAENKRLQEAANEDDRRHTKWLAAAGDCGP